MSHGSHHSEGLRVLVVDDERIIADTLGAILKMNGFYTVARYNAIDAIEQVKAEPFDVVLTDIVMPGMNGIDASREICKICPHCRVILLSGNQATAQLLHEEHQCSNNFEIFTKPVHPLVIIERLRGVLTERKMATDDSTSSL
jgi:DNA-binding NtrC family response regulator